MHDRPPARAHYVAQVGRNGLPDAADRKRENRKTRKARRAARIAAGLDVCPVEHDAAMVEFLIATHWLDIADSNDRAKVGAAVSAMWRSAIPK